MRYYIIQCDFNGDGIRMLYVGTFIFKMATKMFFGKPLSPNPHPMKPLGRLIRDIVKYPDEHCAYGYAGYKPPVFFYAEMTVPKWILFGNVFFFSDYLACPYMVVVIYLVGYSQFFTT